MQPVGNQLSRASCRKETRCRLSQINVFTSQMGVICKLSPICLRVGEGEAENNEGQCTPSPKSHIHERLRYEGQNQICGSIHCGNSFGNTGAGESTELAMKNTGLCCG